MSHHKRGLPRNMLCHEHAQQTAAAGERSQPPSYPICAVLGAHKTAAAAAQTPTGAPAAAVAAAATDVDAAGWMLNAPMANISALVDAHTKQSERFIDEFAASINSHGTVPAELAFQRFAPTGNDTLSAIFAQYGGASQ